MIFVPSTGSTYKLATSYLSEQEADDYLDGEENAERWADLTPTQKKNVLCKASLVIDGAYDYKGRRTDESQLLKFPRGGTSIVPEAIKCAVAVTILDYVGSDGFSNVKAERIGKMSWQFDIPKEGLSRRTLAFLEPYKARGVRINV